MLNLINADIFRLVHEKMLWITTCILSLFYLLAGSGKFTPTFRMNVANHQVEQVNIIQSGAQSPFSLMASPFFLVYFFLPILITVAGSDFSTGAIKNTLSRGFTRPQIYFSKLILVWVIGSIFDLLLITLTLISGTILLGFGQPLDAGYLGELGEVFLLQLPLFLGVISIGICLFFLTRRTAIATLVYLLLFTAAQFANTLLSSFPVKFGNILRYEILYCLKQAVALQNLHGQDLARIVFVGAGYIVITSLLGILVFQKIDIS